MNDTIHATAAELAARIASGEQSAEEVTRAHLDRIAAVDEQVHAFLAVDGERALSQARAVDAKRASGEPLTALAGGALVGWVGPLGLLSGIAVGGLVGLFAVMGDLTESLIKREAKAKNSGSLIPGHGGVFDRVDSLLWAAAIAFMVYSVISATR